MLIKCPECLLQVSDKALSCPHCGYPLKDPPKARPYKSTKRKRLPNGFGQITKISQKNLRKPYRAMVTIGKNEFGKPICKLLKPEAYFETYNDAYAALLKYNQNPYDFSNDITVKELYERWIEEYQKTRDRSRYHSMQSAWYRCSNIYSLKVRDLRARHIKDCLENGIDKTNGHETSSNIRFQIKTLFNLMLDYALEYEIIDKNYARTFNISENLKKDMKTEKKHHISFTDEEMKQLWENITELPFVDVILVQCYMGWRPQELGSILIENVNLENNTIIAGLKTDAGKNRIVPIHSTIKPIIIEKYNEAIQLNSKYLFNFLSRKGGDTRLTYHRYRRAFDNVISNLDLNPEHKPHDPRKQFITTAKKYNLDEYAIKYMVGHEIQDITERIYTDRTIEWLKQELEKIKVNV